MNQENHNDENSNPELDEQNQPNRKQVLYVTNMNYETDIETLKNIFQTFGPVSKVTIVRDKNGRSKGQAYITMDNYVDAQLAKESVDQETIDDYKVKVTMQDKDQWMCDLNYFNDLYEDHLNDLSKYKMDKDRDEDEDDNRTFDINDILILNDDEALITLTNFTCQQFHNLFDIVQPYIASVHCGGRPSKYNEETIFFFALNYCKHYCSYSVMTQQFGIKKTYCCHLIEQTICQCAPVLRQQMIKWYSMQWNIEHHFKFPNFPSCVCIVDGSTQEIARPRENQRLFYDGKHKRHTIKIQGSVGPSGLLVDLRGPVPGSVHDLTLFRESGLLNVLNQEQIANSHARPGDPLVSAMFDKGYQGVQVSLPQAILPRKQTKTRRLRSEDYEYNRQVGHDRVQVERWYGRHKRLWRIMTVRYTHKLVYYNEFYTFCAALTNYHVQCKPLNNDDIIR